MTTLTVVEAGALTTVQDFGRSGRPPWASAGPAAATVVPTGWPTRSSATTRRWPPWR
ncbi:hypothetical protein [Ornithinimicrobium sp. CNJ-824]|uniref:hypothetical protein n=1 Tax=Ornithinimicrobium sp. CNJ-824 TaxID=1904966 RepID=UPI001EDC33A3|nr:hypothetical protein [Ornithinimicrobium sp. CNJ-824]